jgi:hypothetical protein
MVRMRETEGPSRAPMAHAHDLYPYPQPGELSMLSPDLTDAVTACIRKAYAELSDGVLCRNFAAQRCYEETI